MFYLPVLRKTAVRADGVSGIGETEVEAERAGGALSWRVLGH